MNKNLSQQEADEKLQLFLIELDDYLEEFIEVAKENNYELDYSYNSLDELEKFALQFDFTYESDFYSGASRYYGETIVKKFGGKWIISNDIKDNSIYFGFPVIIGHTKFDIQFSSFHVMRNFLALKKIGLLKSAIESHINP